jgi:hypothetical protein
MLYTECFSTIITHENLLVDFAFFIILLLLQQCLGNF